MNHSIYSADRTTHLKIVVLALVASVGFASFEAGVRIYTGRQYSQAEHIVKAESSTLQGEDLLPCCQPSFALCPT